VEISCCVTSNLMPMIVSM